MWWSVTAGLAPCRWPSVRPSADRDRPRSSAGRARRRPSAAVHRQAGRRGVHRPATDPGGVRRPHPPSQCAPSRQRRPGQRCRAVGPAVRRPDESARIRSAASPALARPIAHQESAVTTVVYLGAVGRSGTTLLERVTATSPSFVSLGENGAPVGTRHPARRTVRVWAAPALVSVLDAHCREGVRRLGRGRHRAHPCVAAPRRSQPLHPVLAGAPAGPRAASGRP